MDVNLAEQTVVKWVDSMVEQKVYLMVACSVDRRVESSVDSTAVL